MRFLKRIWRVLLNGFLGLKCSRCGKRGARLLIECGPPRVARVDARAGTRETVMEVRRAEVVCRDCEP